MAGAPNAGARVVIVTGAGHRAFVAGADISECQGLSTLDALTFGQRIQRLSAAGAGTRLKSVWRAVDVGGAAPANSQLAECTLTLPGPAPGSFRLRRGSELWPVGAYKVELCLDDRLVLTLPFKVAP